ncbi:hypothetical protein D3C71_1264800 [compost metagenome]
MRITRQTPCTIRAGADFLPIVLQVLLVEPSFEKRAGIDARCRMRLIEHQVTAAAFGARVEEMVEAHFEQIGGAGITGDVATQLAISVVGTGDHGQGIPAHDRRQALLDCQVPGEDRLAFDAYGVDVRRAMAGPPADVRAARHRHQHVEDLSGLGSAAMGNDRQQSVPPFGDFLTVFCGLARQLGVMIGRVHEHLLQLSGNASRWREWLTRARLLTCSTASMTERSAQVSWVTW